MGRVYLAEHVSLRKRVAIKVLHSDLDVSEESLQRFQREGIAAGKFNHPNAIQIFDFDREGDRTVYLAMEYVEGKTLKAFLADEGRQAPESACDLVRQILSALEAAHAQGIVHRDLKPENVMVVMDPNGQQTIKVLDFGLSKLVDMPLQASLQTQTGRILGTPQYMAPEQCGPGEVDHRTDLYAAGLLLYEMLTGEPTFQGSTLTEVLVKLTTEDAPAIGEAYPELNTPSDLEDILDHALAKKQDERFQSAAEMIEALDSVQLDRVGTKRKRRRKKGRSGLSEARRSWLFGALGAAAIVLAVWVGASMFGGSSEAGGESALVERVARVRRKPAADRTEQEIRYLGFLEESQRALRAEDLTTALREITEALRLPCADAEGYETRAEIFQRQGNTEVALADYEEARQLDSQSVRALVGAAWIYFDNQDYAEALSRFEVASQQDADAAEVWTGQGAVHFVASEWALAEGCLERAIGLDESSYLAQIYLGRLRLDQDRPADAIEPLRKAQRADSARVDSYALLGRALLRSGKASEAEKQLVTAHDLASDSVEIAADLATVYLDAGRHDDLETLLVRGFDLQREGQLAALYGASLMATKQEGRAADYLQTAVARDPEDVGSWRLLGLAKLLSDDAAAARRCFDTAQRLDGPSAAVSVDIAICEMERRNFLKARDALEVAVQLDPEYPEARLLYGVLLLDLLGEREAGLVQLRAYRSLGGEDPRVAQWLEER